MEKERSKLFALETGWGDGEKGRHQWREGCTCEGWCTFMTETQKCNFCNQVLKLKNKLKFKKLK